MLNRNHEGCKSNPIKKNNFQIIKKSEDINAFIARLNVISRSNRWENIYFQYKEVTLKSVIV